MIRKSHPRDFEAIYAIITRTELQELVRPPSQYILEC
jgi:hypothetical protein